MSVGDRIFESRWRVNEFRRFIPKVGAAGSGLVQFWGPRFRREYVAGEEPGSWEAYGTEESLRTVEVVEIEKITDAKR